MLRRHDGHGGDANVGTDRRAPQPFTAVPTNESAFRDWSVGPLFYSAVFVAEVMGQTNTTQLFDMNANGGSDQTPAYAIYENGALARMVLINFMTEQNGQGGYTATISVGGGQTGEANATPGAVRERGPQRDQGLGGWKRRSPSCLRAEIMQVVW